MFAVDAHQLTECRDEHHTLVRLGIGRYTEVFRELIRSVAEGEMPEVLRHRIEIVEAVLVALHPVVLLRVEVDALHAAMHTLLVQPTCRRTVHLLRHWVVHRIAHPLLQPEPSTMTFLDLVNAVVAQRGRVLVVTEIGTDAVTVVAVQTEVRTKPHVTLGVTEDAEHFRVRKAFTGVDTTETHVRNDCSFCYNPDAKHRQEDGNMSHYSLFHLWAFVIFIGQRYVFIPKYANKSSKKTRPALYFIQIDRQSDAKRGANSEGRSVIVCLRFEVKKVVDGGIEMDTAQKMML